MGAENQPKKNYEPNTSLLVYLLHARNPSDNLFISLTIVKLLQVAGKPGKQILNLKFKC